LAAGGAFGVRFGAFPVGPPVLATSRELSLVAASSLASAARRGSRRGAWGYRSPSTTPRIARDSPTWWRSAKLGRMKSREEHLSWAKQRALICVDVGRFADAVAGLRGDLAGNALSKGVMTSDQARRGYKAAANAALGRGSQALTEWVESFK